MRSIESKTSVILDIFFCAVLMPVLLMLGPARYWPRQWPGFFVIACAFLYGCYFALLRADIPRMIIERRYWRVAATAGALVCANYLLSLYPLPDMEFVTPALSEYQTRLRNFGVSVTLWLMFSIVAGYTLAVSFVKALYGQLLLRKRLEAQRDKVQLAVFKAQISPHFLFNTLNSLYSLVIGTSQRAEDAFIKFTEILKYTYVTIEKETIPLSEEARCVESYIDLQLIRLNRHTTVRWHSEIDNPSAMVPPMLMLTFVENAFKYGASTSNDCEIDISLELRGGRLRFHTRNSIMKHTTEFRQDMPVGIDNSRARLAALFPGRHTLEASERDGVFEVLLEIDLTPPPHNDGEYHPKQ